MSEKLGRVMYQIDASYHVLWTEREIAERPEIPFRPVHVFTPEELTELLIDFGTRFFDMSNPIQSTRLWHTVNDFLAQRGLGGNNDKE